MAPPKQAPKCTAGTCKLPSPCACQEKKDIPLNRQPQKPANRARYIPDRPKNVPGPPNRKRQPAKNRNRSPGKATRAGFQRAVRAPVPAAKPRPMPRAPKKPKKKAVIPPATLARLKSVSRWEAEVLQLVNASRARYGVSPVRVSATLSDVARRHNADQAFVQRRISHVGSDGARIGDRMKREGYLFAYASENVAAGQRNPKHVHRSLMNSPGHRRNVLSSEVVDMGLHVGRGTDGRLYWTQVFGRRKIRV